MTRAALIPILLLLPGCQPAPRAPVGPPLPPPEDTLVQSFPEATTNRALVARMLSLPPANPAFVGIGWRYPAGYATNGVSFNVYHSSQPRLSTMTFLANVATNEFRKATDQPAEFFQVKATARGLESGWATQ